MFLEREKKHEPESIKEKYVKTSHKIQYNMYESSPMYTHLPPVRSTFILSLTSKQSLPRLDSRFLLPVARDRYISFLFNSCASYSRTPFSNHAGRRLIFLVRLLPYSCTNDSGP